MRNKSEKLQEVEDVLDMAKQWKVCPVWEVFGLRDQATKVFDVSRNKQLGEQLGSPSAFVCMPFWLW